MRIAIYDDLHIETDAQQSFQLEEADVCVLAGDICVAAHLQPHRQDADARSHKKACQRFFQRISDTYNHTFYVMGNHEHYRGVFETTPTILRNFLSQWPNIQLLDKETSDLNGVRFFGATMWTSCNNNNPITNEVLKNYLNDFSVIHRQGGAVWTPEMSYLEWCNTQDRLLEELQRAKEDGIEKMVVISHHCPSHLSLDERFAGEIEGNFGYFSDMDILIMDHPIIKVWFHGHVHIAKDYFIGDTHIVCNPRGYPREIHWDITGFNARKVVVI